MRKFILALSILLMAAGTARADLVAVADMPQGAVVQLGPVKFVKLGAAGTNGPFLSLLSINSIMQTWGGCATIPTPTGTAQSTVVTLTDIRDGKEYDVTKFADGNCWMLNNLAYGGDGVDGCAGKTTFDGYGGGGTTAASKYGTWTNGTAISTNSLYGDCRDSGVATYGYYYNWQAAVQNAGAYYNVSYQPTQPTQGICPEGWHLPSTTEFCNLDKAVYNKTSCASYTLAKNFYQPYSTTNPDGNFGGLYSGYSSATGSSSDQGSYAYYWSSSQGSATYAYRLNVGSGGYVYPQYNYSKYLGFSVRCLKD